MDSPTPLMTSVSVPTYGEVVIEANDGKRYHANLSVFQTVACFPVTEDSWRKVSIDSYGLALIWASRFEVHVDQVIGLADHVEKAEYAA